MIATAKDLGATALVGASVAVVWANASDAGWPLVSNTRIAALIAMALGLGACILGAQTPTDGGAPSMKTWHDRVGALLGGFSGVLGLVALAFAWQPALVAYAVVVVALWAVTTVRHLVTPRSPATV